MHKWKKGESGNPGGRPKEVANLRALAREHSAEAIQTIIEVIQDAEASRTAHLAAAKEILDRGYGQPLQEMPELPPTEQTIGWEPLSREEWYEKYGKGRSASR